MGTAGAVRGSHWASTVYHRSDAGIGSGTIAATAMLSLDQRIAPAARFGRAGAPRTPSRFPAFDPVVDLGMAIGSATWWRGLATCVTLCAATYTLSPTMRPLVRVVGTPMPAADWEEARAQSIAPLAWGGDSGRHMGATDAVQPLAGTPERPSIDLTAAIGQGDGLRHALQRAGVGAGEADRIAALTARVVDPAQVAAGTALALTLGRRASPNVPRPLDALSFRARFDLKVSFERINNVLVMREQPIAIDNAPLRVTGLVGDGIYVAATSSGAPSGPTQDFIRALAPKVALGDLDRDTRFDFVVERQRAATGEVRFGKLLYVGLEQGRRALRMIQWTIGGRTEWYDAAGVGEQRQGFTSPVANARKTSGFGMRMHPLLGYSRMHQGTDYGAVYGTPIRAVTDGVVSFAGWHGGHGNMVKLTHAGGLGTGYGHMSRIAVSPGSRVAQGQVIGYVGSTGLSTGPHLHFEVYRGGVPVNPSSVNFQSQSLLSGAELAAFHDRLRRITSVGGETASR